MLLESDARTLIASRVDLTALADEEGQVSLSGKYRLYELEALCVVLRDHLGKNAKGAEDFIAEASAKTVVMPLPRLEAIVRSMYKRLINNITDTMIEDRDQLTNPGSSPVYGVPSKIAEGGIEFNESAISDMTTDELTLIANETTRTLSSLKCSITTQGLAVAMLMSVVFEKDQEKFALDIDRAQRRSSAKGGL